MARRYSAAAAGVRGAIIISAGFKERGPEGAELEARVLAEATRGKGPHNVRLAAPPASRRRRILQSLASRWPAMLPVWPRSMPQPATPGCQAPDMKFDPILLVYALPLLALWIGIVALSRRKSAKAMAILDDNRQAGLHEPASLHPVIDPALCLGCAACARACPEKTVLGIIDGKAASANVLAEVARGAAELIAKGVKPGLAVVLVGDDPASRAYVRSKDKKCRDLGLQWTDSRQGRKQHKC